MNDTLPLIAGVVLALTCAAYTFWPSRDTVLYARKSRQDYLEERRDVLYDNLRDLNFEHRSGKYAEDDFLRQREELEAEAAGVLAELDDLKLASVRR